MSSPRSAEAVERAMGLMAGYGLQLWPILQLQGMPPVLAQKLRYYADPEFAGLFLPEAGR
jgi:type IV secretory pathway TraG/TraD family ATPase VirD4